MTLNINFASGLKPSSSAERSRLDSMFLILLRCDDILGDVCKCVTSSPVLTAFASGASIRLTCCCGWRLCWVLPRHRDGETRGGRGEWGSRASQALQGRSARPRTERPSIPTDSGARTKHLGAGGPASSSQFPSLRNEAASRGCARRSARAPSGGAAGATARPRREHMSTRLCLRGTCALTKAGGAAFSFAMALSGVPRPPFLKKLSEV